MDNQEINRHDGWTASRREIFLAALSDGLSVIEAAARAGPSASSAYRLRRREAAFAAACEAAIERHWVAVCPAPRASALSLLSDRALMQAITRLDPR